MAMSDQFDQLASTTLRKWAKSELTQQVWTADAITAFLWEKGRVQMYDGGEQIGVPLLYGANDTVMSYTGYDKLDNTPQSDIGTAIFNWKNYAVSVVIDNEMLRKNSGMEAKISLLKSKVMQAQESMTDKLATDSYLDGTGNGGKNITGLAAIVSASGTLAGINRSTYSWWQSQSNTTSTSVATSWMRTMINDIRGTSAASSDPNKAGVCDIIIAPQDLYESFEALIEPHLRVTGNTLGALGWETLKFKGAEVVFSDKCQSGTMYFLSSKYMNVFAHRDANFITTDFKQPVDQDARVAHILWMGNLVTSNCRRMGVATNKTT